MTEKPGSQPCDDDSGADAEEMLHEDGEVHTPGAAQFVEDGEEQWIQERTETVKGMKVFAREQHSGDEIVVFLIESRHAERRSADVFHEETDSDDETKNAQKNKSLSEREVRNILSEERVVAVERGRRSVSARFRILQIHSVPACCERSSAESSNAMNS